MNDIKQQDVRVDPADPIPHLRKLISRVRPAWKSETVSFQESPKGVNSGCLNNMLTAYVGDDKKDAVMFRTYGSKEHDQFLNREREVFNAKLIHDRYGFAPRVILTYENGFCYDYIHGEVMTPRTITLEKNWKTIAEQIALLHSTDVDEKLWFAARLSDYFCEYPVDYPDSLKDPQLNKIFQEELPKKDYVFEEVGRVLEAIERLRMRVGLCHNDLRAENMIWNKDTGAITFVDFEAAGFARQAGDIAYHFWRYTGLENPDYSKFPGKDFQMAWLGVYLRTFNRATKGYDIVTDAELERLYVQVNTYYLLYLIKTLCCVSHLERYEKIPFDIFSAVLPSYREYRRIKEFVLSMSS